MYINVMMLRLIKQGNQRILRRRINNDERYVLRVNTKYAFTHNNINTK